MSNFVKTSYLLLLFITPIQSSEENISLNEFDDCDFNVFFNDYEFIEKSEPSINVADDATNDINNNSLATPHAEQVIQLKNKEKQKKYYFYALSRKKLNQVWHHPSVLALTPEQIEIKPLGLSPDSVSVKPLKK